MKILKMFTFSALALLMLVLPAMALDQAAPAAPASPTVTVPGFTQWDLGTYFGLSAAVVGVLGLVKMLFPAWIVDKEPHIGLALSYILGISTKLFIPGMYKDVNWVIFLLSLLGVAVGAKLGHDHLLNEVIKGHSPDKKLDEKVAEKVEEKIAEIKKV
jgi:hypothetical protein